jgi:hypothetical protein
VTFTAHFPPSGTITAYMAGASDQLYMLQVIAQGQGDANDPALQAAVQSFKLLPSTTDSADSAPGPSLIPKGENSLSQWLWYGIIAMGIITVIRWLTSRNAKGQ